MCEKRDKQADRPADVIVHGDVVGVMPGHWSGWYPPPRYTQPVSCLYYADWLGVAQQAGEA